MAVSFASMNPRAEDDAQYAITLERQEDAAGSLPLVAATRDDALVLTVRQHQDVAAAEVDAAGAVRAAHDQEAPLDHATIVDRQAWGSV